MHRLIPTEYQGRLTYAACKFYHMHKMRKTEEEWRQLLTAEEYHVLRQSGTEPPGTGKYTHHNTLGSYHCRACDTELFNSEGKFDSACGWPAFWIAIAGDRIQRVADMSHGMRRIEVRCSNCDSHLGHVFNDGPQPTGERYCINSICLQFYPQASDTDGSG